jgi:hypothetical protein
MKVPPPRMAIPPDDAPLLTAAIARSIRSTRI